VWVGGVLKPNLATYDSYCTRPSSTVYNRLWRQLEHQFLNTAGNGQIWSKPAFMAIFCSFQLGKLYPHAVMLMISRLVLLIQLTGDTLSRIDTQYIWLVHVSTLFVTTASPHSRYSREECTFLFNHSSTPILSQ
jgi:hypothetical protein